MKESVDGFAPQFIAPVDGGTTRAEEGVPSSAPSPAMATPEGAIVLPIHTDELAAARAKIRLQLTGQVYEKASNVAEFELAKLRSRQIAVSEDGADVVQSILLDTFEGRLRWRHERCSLLQHLCDTVRDRVRRIRERARPEIRIDALDAGHDGERADVENEIGGIQHHPGADPVRAAEIRDVARLTEDHLWGMAVAIGDTDLMRGLAALMHGARGQNEMAEALGMDSVIARRVWRRVRALAEGLPAELRDRALELL